VVRMLRVKPAQFVLSNIVNSTISFVRILKTIVLVSLAYFIVYIVPVLLGMIGISSPTVQSLVAIFSLIPIFGYLATKVGYRRKDGLFVLIPMYNIIWIMRISYRIANLPNRGWRERETD
jgi:hypothetical protein